MSVSRFAISFDADLTRAVRRATGATPLSAWLADAARRKLRAEGLLRVVREWEDDHSALRAEELQAEARRQRPHRRRR
jgi:hypothetical protein